MGGGSWDVSTRLDFDDEDDADEFCGVDGEEEDEDDILIFNI